MTVIRRLFARVCREARTIPRVNRVVDKVFQEYYQLPFPPTHYYSPLPDLPSVKRNLSRWYKQSESPGIDWNLEGQFKLAEDLAAYTGETQLLPHFAQVTQHGYGQGYPPVEAHLLYMILRHFKPAQCIEVGSGVSTFYALSALRANRERDGVNSNMTCIEPYPYGKLRELVTEHRVRLRECEVQDIELSAFEELSANDVLFIDSSHVSKKDSDVEFLYLEVLPRLRNGVVIHIHDMPFPMPTVPLGRYFDMHLGYEVLAVGPEVILRLNEGIDGVGEIFECSAGPGATVCSDVHYMSRRKAQSPEQRKKMFKAIRTERVFDPAHQVRDQPIRCASNFR